MAEKISQIGPYSIDREIGRGGMGVVYLAHDARLDRSVAIKALPESLATDSDRLSRFEREARVLASLNHPHIAGIHGLEEVDGGKYLVLEYVPGSDLSEALERGPLPVDEALQAALQVADALESAHEAGIVHRDLKPANVRLTPDGAAKVLDFGLAKPLPPGVESPSKDSTYYGLTQENVVLGTPVYMSPEQVKGKPLDRRTDIWSFGCVLFEMLSGKKAFAATTMAELMHAIREGEPDWSTLPARTPARVTALIRRCLEKDPRQRLRDMGDVRLELEAVRNGAPEPVAAGSSSKPIQPWAVGLVTLVIGLWIGSIFLREYDYVEVPTLPQLAVEIEIPEIAGSPRISHDGRSVLYEARLADVAGATGRGLFVRHLGSFEPQRVPIVGGVDGFAFSPSGERVAFVSEQPEQPGSWQIMQVPASLESPPTLVAPWPDDGNSGSPPLWLDERRIAVRCSGFALQTLFIDERGKTERLQIRAPEGSTWINLEILHLLPGTQYALGLANQYDEQGYVPSVVAIDLVSGESQLILNDASFGQWSPTGHLVFSRGDQLLAVRFDAETLETSGAPVAILSGMRTVSSWESAWFELSDDGTLLFTPGGNTGASRYLAWWSDGRFERWSNDALPLTSPFDIARDENFVLLTRVGPGGLYEVWSSELDAPSLRRLVAVPGADCSAAYAIPGTRDFIYSISGSGGQSGLYRRSFEDEGIGERLSASLDSTDFLFPATVSPDGTLVSGTWARSGRTRHWLVPIDQVDELRYEDCFTDWQGFPRISRDGQWLVHASEVNGPTQRVVRRLDPAGKLGPPAYLPTTEGERPIWAFWSFDPADDATTLFSIVRSSEGRMLCKRMQMTSESPVRFGDAELVMDLTDQPWEMCVSHSDGRLLFVLHGDDELPPGRLRLLTGMHELLNERLPAGD